jgi:hypothetical protein
MKIEKGLFPFTCAFQAISDVYPFMGAELVNWRVDFQEKPLVFPS